MAYITKQRTLLSGFLRARGEAHFSMREILDFAHRNGIGTATVYRYLDKLVQDGQLCKFNTDSLESGACYQWRDADCHLYHFVCNECGKCFHIDCPQLKSVNAHIRENHDFEVYLEKTVFRGHCAACAGKESK
ncbi:MAG: transcriptional repressor [Clostridia bacterium]|nr:transcriptional repressor [Oscillospiraceae bacterium]MBQ7032347.1 transcriptional repressor [Clostridia bacterium]